MSELKVMLFGASRSGKTSILASMMEGRNLLLDYRLKLKPSDDASTFAYQVVEMKDLCDSKKHKETPRMTTLRGTTTVETFRYKLEFQDLPDNEAVDIIFHDIPGEYVKLAKVVELDTLEKLVKECQIIIVAVDTPALLWACHNGQADQEFITAANALQSLFTDLGKSIDADPHQDNKSLKSIIFAPIKCESYINNRNFSNDISFAIGKAYSNVITAAQQKRCKVFIIPMQTIGGVKVHHNSRPEEMFVLKYGSNAPTNKFIKGQEYEEKNINDETYEESYITRCEKINSQTVRIARSGVIYQIQEGDTLISTADMPEYPYVFAKGHPLPYIWYQATGTGFKQEKCERVLYEVIKLTIQQIAANNNCTIRELLTESNKGGFLSRLWKRFLETLGIALNSNQLRGLCRALQSMQRNGVFNDSIVLVNNIDQEPDSPLRIP